MKKIFQISLLLSVVFVFFANNASAATITFNEKGFTGPRNNNWGITLYDDSGFNAFDVFNIFSEKAATTVTSPTYPSCINLKDVKDVNGVSWSNSKVSAVEVPAGQAVTLYNEENCSGYERTLFSSDANLGDDSIGSTGGNWNDTPKSIKIILGDNFPGKAILYDDINYGGISTIISGDTALNSLWNDRSSSIIVVPGNTVVLYENSDYGGYSITITSSKENTQKTVNQDWISSLRINPSSNNSGGSNTGSNGNTGSPTIAINNPITADSLTEIVDNIINFIFTISIVLVPLMIVWAGGMYVLSAGNETKITKAKNIILYTIAGLAILLFSKGFVAIINQLLE